MSASNRTTKPLQSNQQPLRFAIYTRLSSAAQNDASLESQEMMCRRAVNERGGVVVQVYGDAAEIGWTLDRDGFIRMREDAAKKKFDAVMMWKFDRLARDQTQSTMIKTLFRREYGVKLYCVEGFSEDDDDTAYTSMMEQMMGVIASFYSRNLSSEVRRSVVHRHEQGRYNGTRAMLGYVLATEKTPKHHRSVKATEATPPGLYIVPREAAIVRRAFRMYATGKHSYQSIADFLMSKAKYLNLGEEAIGIDWVREMLQNRIYLGEVSYAEVVYKEGFRQKKQNTRKRRAWRPGIHQAIITNDLFDACERIRASRQKLGRVNRQETHHYLLSGKMWCGYCLENKPMELRDKNFGKMRCQHVNRGSSEFRYLCAAKERGYEKCGQKIVRCKVIDPQVIDALFQASQRLPTDIEAAVNKAISLRAEAAAMIERMEELEAIISRVDLSWEHGFISEAEYVQKRYSLQQEINSLKPVDYDELKANALVLKEFPRRWLEAKSDEEQQRLVDQIVKAVIIKGDVVQTIILRGDTTMLFDDRGTWMGNKGLEPARVYGQASTELRATMSNFCIGRNKDGLIRPLHLAKRYPLLTWIRF